MWMATRSDSGFRNEQSLSSMISRHAINFQSNTSWEMFQMGPYLGRSGSMVGINNAASNDSVSGFKLETTSLACDWSTEEQLKLDDGLEKYKNKPNIMKYVKIAATLPEKTVRDVALRCRWMTRKRRKAEELYSGKRISYSKKKQQAEMSSQLSVLPNNMASDPFLIPFTNSTKHITSQDLSGHAISLLEQNVKAFSEIRANLSSYKVHDNIDLFCQARNNLITIQNDMNNMPGLMSQMPPLPVAITDDFSATLEMPFNTMQNGNFHMKQEPLG